MDAEVVIVGAGLAGCAAALELAACGRDVIVLERGGRDRDKVCGEGLMPHGVETLRSLGLLPAVLATRPVPFRGIRYQVGTSVANGTFPSGHGLGVRRARIDRVVGDAAASHPRIELRTGIRVRSVSGVAGRMEVRTDSGRLTARAVVGADGLHSVVRRSLGLQVRAEGRRRYGARVHISHDGPDPARVGVYITPVGELYITPTAPGEMNIAVLLEHAQARTLAGGAEARILAVAGTIPQLEPWLRHARTISVAASCGPLRQRASAWACDGAVLVGDAAFFLDGITGEGMSLALSGGVLAARTLDRAMVGGEASRERLAAYPRRFARDVRHKVRLTEVVLAGIRHRRLSGWAVRQLATRPALFGALLDLNGGHGGLEGIARAVLAPSAPPHRPTVQDRFGEDAGQPALQGVAPWA
ncbi:MAG: 2-polyprenyl-6-methoxyphenol hydroxylase-like FAD-dependent oxidoreductase [Myxococcota bacterium]